MKCTICGFEITKLDYGKLRVTARTRIKVLDQHIKNKQTMLDLDLCGKCRNEMVALITQKAMEREGKSSCTNDCGSCDICR